MNNDEFNKFYKENYKYVYNQLLFILKNEEIVEELINDIFLRIYRGNYNYNITKSLLKTICKNTAIDYIRKKKETKLSVDNEDTGLNNIITDNTNPLSDIIKDENIKILYKSINKLKEDYKVIMYLILQGYTYQQIAEKRKLKLGTVKKMVFQSKKYLKKYINYLN